jgi:DNA repair exonuclease SbcCD ATPase subunit
MEGNDFFTIYEASQITGKCQNTIHRYIKKGKLHVKPCQYNGKQVMTVEKAELERVFNITGKTCQDMSKPTASHVNTGNDMSIHVNPSAMKEELKEVIQEFFTTKQAELMRPIEEMALYKLGAVEKENTFLKTRLETVLQENQELQEKIKALPDKAYIEKMQKENQEKEKDLIIQIEMERKEKADLLSRVETIQKEQEEKLKQSEEIHRKELEARQEEQKDLHRQELEQVKKEAEEEKKQIAETWRKELELSKRPWWKLW